MELANQEIPVNPISEPDAKDLANRFSYHAPKNQQPAKYVTIRENAKGLAELLLTYAPPSRERSLAITKLEEVVFWANAAIARNE